MKPRAFFWTVAAFAAVAIVTVAFVFFRNPGTTYAEVSRSSTLRFPSGRSLPSMHDNDATAGAILPYLATPHAR